MQLIHLRCYESQQRQINGINGEKYNVSFINSVECPEDGSDHMLPSIVTTFRSAT
jgi:hypothetical protein